jgi:hypothetical protein
MSEPVQLAKSARELLAAALNALQASRTMSPQIEELAEPIAQAMSIMHRIERSGGQSLEGRDLALAHVRDVLNRLQVVTVVDPVVDVLMEHIAKSLSKVHALTRIPASAGHAAAPPPLPAAAAAPPPVPAPPLPSYPQPAAQYAPPGQSPRAYAPPGHSPQAYAPPAHSPQAYAPPAHSPQAYAPPAHSPQAYAPPAHSPQAYAPPAHSPQPYPPPAPAPRVQAHLPAPQAGADLPPPSANAIIDVELGTFTPSNFYKGLGASDVIEHGGIFVATYKIPKVGSAVSLRVRLPGDYEFYASAMVRWTREHGGSGDSAEPGFGARFMQISPEGRQLVQRYTRNREPLFYDDL